jgi:hypothetical protein
LHAISQALFARKSNLTEIVAPSMAQRMQQGPALHTVKSVRANDTRSKPAQQQSGTILLATKKPL